MNLYLLEQDYVSGYYTYDSAVVVAENETTARFIYPTKSVTQVKNNKWVGTYIGEWVKFADIDRIKVTLLGKSKNNKSGLILASFNAG